MKKKVISNDQLKNKKLYIILFLTINENKNNYERWEILSKTRRAYSSNKKKKK